jgi:uncharacterized protein (DUF2461 family)
MISTRYLVSINGTIDYSYLFKSLTKAIDKAHECWDADNTPSSVAVYSHMRYSKDDKTPIDKRTYFRTEFYQSFLGAEEKEAVAE